MKNAVSGQLASVLSWLGLSCRTSEAIVCFIPPPCDLNKPPIDYLRLLGKSRRRTETPSRKPLGPMAAAWIQSVAVGSSDVGWDWMESVGP